MVGGLFRTRGGIRPARREILSVLRPRERTRRSIRSGGELRDIPTVESFNEGGWKYIGILKHGGRDNQRYFYISPDGGTILQFLEDDGYTEVAENEKLFTVGILVASVG